jgi:Helicase HerA, central domain
VLPLILVISWIAGNKLSKLAKPENPKASIAIRELASWISIIGMLAIAIFLVYIFIIYTLVFLWLTLSDEYVAYSSIERSSMAINQIWLVAYRPLTFIILGSFLGLVFSLYLSYYFIPQWESGEGLHDVNSIIKLFKKLNSFNPMPYIDVARGCFVGLDLNKNPIYIAWKKIRETHIQILGSTGAGKGVIMTLIASQSALAGECVIWFDPKNDRYSPKILSAIAKKAGKEFHLINLNPDQPPQFNILADAKSHEIEELLVAGFDLIGKGTDGDFHRGKDEDAAIQASQIAIEKNALSIPALIHQCALMEDIKIKKTFGEN